jgi:hypothetical protein
MRAGFLVSGSPAASVGIPATKARTLRAKRAWGRRECRHFNATASNLAALRGRTAPFCSRAEQKARLALLAQRRPFVFEELGDLVFVANEPETRNPKPELEDEHGGKRKEAPDSPPLASAG